MDSPSVQAVGSDETRVGPPAPAVPSCRPAGPGYNDPLGTGTTSREAAGGRAAGPGQMP